jgi:hypothetical protein
MNFADLNAQVADFRHALQTQIDPKAMGEVGVRGPAGSSDEAAFLRLAAWCFGLLFEQGRITIPFLLNESLPDASPAEIKTHKTTRSLAQALRTWLFHSLTAEKEHDLAISKNVSTWFLATCGSTSPQNTSEWQTCFGALCAQVTALIAYCTKTVSKIVTAKEDAEMIVTNLRNRLKREWAPYQFDELVENAAARLGEKINARSFRDSRLSEWRKFLASLPDDADCVLEMERRIDGEVADHFRATLSIPLRELSLILDVESGPELKVAVEKVRQLEASGLRGKAELLEALKIEIRTEGKA